MSGQRLPVALMSESALRNRRTELEDARSRIAAEIRRIDGVLRGSRTARKTEPAHGTPAGYKAHRDATPPTPTCAKCRAWKASYQRQLRARRRAEHQPNPKENTMPTTTEPTASTQVAP